MTFLTPHGDYLLKVPSKNFTLKEVCAFNGLPFQSLSFYIQKGDSKEFSNFVGFYEKVSDLEKVSNEIIIRADRNINYRSLVKKDINRSRCHDASAEYSFSDPSQTNVLLHKEFSPKECQEYIANKVKNFLESEVNFDPNKKVVLGISGGGDSNTLVKAFLSSGLVSKDQIVCVMMMGIPDWDLGKSRAEEICKIHDVEFRIIDENKVADLIGHSGKCDWVTAFEKNYPDSDLEVLGTLAIRLSLSHVAKEIAAQSIVIGLNLEDLLAEGLLMTMAGKLPLPFPVRKVDNVEVWYPLYECPKKILDGCYPKYSLQNYMDRYPSKMTGRAIPYYMAQMLHSVVPGVEFTMLDGLKKISKMNNDYFYFDKDLGFSTLKKVSLKEKTLWKKFLNKIEQ